MITTIWPDKETRLLETLTRELCNMDAPAVRERVVAVVPLYSPGAVEAIAGVEKQCREHPEVKSLHILGLSSSLAPAVSGRDIPAHTEAEHKAMRILPSLTIGELEVSFSVIENYNCEGECLNFTTDTLALFLARILQALYHHYETVFPERLLRDFAGRNFSIGAAKISYDVKRSIAILHNLVLQELLGRNGYGQETIDEQKVREIAGQVLDGLEKCFPKFFQDVVYRQYRTANSVDAAVETAEIEAGKIFKDFDGQFVGLMSSDKLIFREKEAVLALVLGENSSEPAFDSLLKDAALAFINTDTDFSKIDDEINLLRDEIEGNSVALNGISRNFIKKRREIRELKLRLATLKSKESQLIDDKNDAKLISAVARIWIDNYKKFADKWQTYYERLLNFNVNMRALYKELSRQRTLEDELGTIVLSDDELLVGRFATTVEHIAEEINIKEAIDCYADSLSAFDEFMSRTVDHEINRAISALFSNFSLAEYLMGQKYEYLSEPDTPRLLGQLVDAAKPTCRNFAPELPPMDLIDFVGVEPQRLRTWKAAVEPLYPYPVKDVATQKASELLMITVQPVPIEYCI